MKLLQKITEVAQRIQDKTGRSPGQLVFWPTFCLLVVIHCLWNTSLIYLDGLSHLENIHEKGAHPRTDFR